MSDKLLKPGEFGIYTLKNELVEIKEVLEMVTTERQRLKQDGLNGPATGPFVEIKKPMYRVYTHTGDTAALCDVHLITPIPNAYAFNIRRIRVDEE